MNQIVTLPPPQITGTNLPVSKGEREQAAFQKMLPTLLASQRGKFVAIHEEKVVDIGDNKLELALRVLNMLGNTDIYVGLVTDEPAPVFTI